jgi:hypothetical protein
MVLSMQKEIGFLNEPKALWYEANRYDDLIGSYSDGAAKYLLDAADATSEISACVKSIYSSFLKFSGSKRILDKFPEMIFRIGYLEQIFSDAKYIFLYRNPWDTISSTALWSAGHTNTAREENWWGVRNRKWKLMLEQVIPNDPLLSAYQHEVSLLKSDYDKAAAEWIVTMNQGLKMYTRFPEKIMLVQYEKLCMQPRKVLSDICRFAALQPDENMYRYGEKVLKLPAPAVEADVKPFLEEGIMRLSERLGYSASAKVME